MLSPYESHGLFCHGSDGRWYCSTCCLVLAVTGSDVPVLSAQKDHLNNAFLAGQYHVFSPMLGSLYTRGIAVGFMEDVTYFKK